ncbi:F pilus assembly Type-IV secretion system for plasmid transfer family protein [Orientia chuto str. Dubai]|uniref:F pilus assembly Type-IV secretion system for plasmid transfer family protein n=1 Tax=Orientia chuto str. Dubai TaxID=1359168 RepID=A0A0F3MJ19_9RICK|nr:F pilus assembly Type-IV secretion system for plasmid transfer family protein [Orientia chuto str. Dubai]
MIGSHHIEHFLNNWQSYRKGKIFVELAKRRAEFLHERAQNAGMIKDKVLLILVTIPDLNANIDDMIREEERLYRIRLSQLD